MVSVSPQARRREIEEDSHPKTFLEKQDSLSHRFLERRRRSRERFHRRARSFSLGKEAARNFFLAGCLLFDVLIVPEPALILGGGLGLALSGILLAAALALEVDFYRNRFALPPAEDRE